MAHNDYLPPDGPNRSLPPLNPLMARSTIAAVLSALSAILPLLGDGGIASTAAELVANGDAIQQGAEDALRALDALLGLGFVVWFWLERRAPWRRLSFRNR